MPLWIKSVIFQKHNYGNGCSILFEIPLQPGLFIERKCAGLLEFLSRNLLEYFRKTKPEIHANLART